MIIKGYGIELLRLGSKDIEMVRNWRNSKHIQDKMEYRQEISPFQQQKWFESIDNIDNNYFVITTENKKIGLIYAAEINWNENFTGNGGIFIHDQTYWESIIPLSASLLLTDTSLLMNIEKSYIKILNNNPTAIAFNKALGYKLIANQEKVFNQLYVLETKQYINSRNKIRNKLFDSKTYKQIDIQLNKSHPNTAFLLDRINNSNHPEKKQFKIQVK